MDYYYYYYWQFFVTGIVHDSRCVCPLNLNFRSKMIDCENTLDDGIQYRFDFSKYYLFFFISKIKIYLSEILHHVDLLVDF